MTNKKTYTLQLRIFNGKEDNNGFIAEWEVFSNMKAAKQTRINLVASLREDKPMNLYSTKSLSEDVDIEEYYNLSKLYVFSITTFELKTKPLKY